MLFPKPVKTKRGNTVRKISKENAHIVHIRDGMCIICGDEEIEEIHHAFYGIDANYGPNRNDPDQLVGLGSICHNALHFSGGNDYRDDWAIYVSKFSFGDVVSPWALDHLHDHGDKPFDRRNLEKMIDADTEVWARLRS